jgi:predicted O-methyltransferase YrrM
MKPEKICTVNQAWPLHKAFQDNHWEQSGGTKHCAVLMAAMIAAYDIRKVLEIGLWQGFMTRVLVKALASTGAHSSLLVSCDINPKACERSAACAKGYPVEHRVVVGDTKDTLAGVHETFGLIFVDGDHTYEAAMSDIRQSEKMLERCGIMVVHDYSRTAHPGVFRAVNEFIEDTKWPCFFLPENRLSTDYRSVVLQKAWDYF